jgi:hypothetical protein
VIALAIISVVLQMIELVCSETNLRECEDQSWFAVQAVPVYSVTCLRVPSGIHEREVEHPNLW